MYFLYIDFKNAFGSIDHTYVLAIMKDLGYPKNAIKLVGNIYLHLNTIFTGEYFGQIQSTNIKRNTNTQNTNTKRNNPRRHF